MRYYLIAGEASGDLHASCLMHALKRHDRQAEFRFIGGDLMAAEGGTCVRHYRELAYMGFVPVLRHLPTILGNMRMCKRDISEWHPDAVILIDYPGFNLSVAKFVRLIPTYRYTIIFHRKYGRGKSIVSRVSGGIKTGCSAYCRLRWTFMKASIITR